MFFPTCHTFSGNCYEQGNDQKQSAGRRNKLETVKEFSNLQIPMYDDKQYIVLQTSDKYHTFRASLENASPS